jgi:hypothetical protein
MGKDELDSRDCVLAAWEGIRPMLSPLILVNAAAHVLKGKACVKMREMQYYRILGGSAALENVWWRWISVRFFCCLRSVPTK